MNDDYLRHALKSYVDSDDAHYKNLFSILMYDLHEKDEKSLNKYNLINKFEIYQRIHSKVKVEQLSKKNLPTKIQKN